MRALDRELVDSLVDVGLADSATYEALDGSTKPCRAMIDQGVRKLSGGGAEVISDQATVTLFKDEIAEPVGGAVVIADGARYELDELVGEDESQSIWSAIHE